MDAYLYYFLNPPKALIHTAIQTKYSDSCYTGEWSSELSVICASCGYPVAMTVGLVWRENLSDPCPFQGWRGLTTSN